MNFWNSSGTAKVILRFTRFDRKPSVGERVLEMGNRMLQKRASLAVILALSLALAACGGSAEEESSGATAPTPAPAQAAAAPQAEPTPAESASDETAAAAGDSGELAEHLSEKTMRLWDVYNTHEPDALQVFYSDAYWAEEVEEIRQNMQPFKNNNLTFTAEETSPPTEVEPGKWEIKHTARFQGGEVRMVFVYEQFGEDWLLTYAKPE